MRAAPRKRPSRRSSAPDLHRHAGLPVCEGLEPRQVLSAFIYSDLADLVKAPGPSVLVDGYNGPIAVVGDLDGDSIADILVGQSGIYTTIKTYGERSSAAIISGKTGAIMRTIAPPGPLNRHLGWSVAGLGDVDADGTPDYGVSTGLDPSSGDVVFIYSGKTGDPLYILQNDQPVGTIAGAIVARAGDVDGDGHADILVGFASDRALVYSGATGLALHSFSVADVAGSYHVGLEVAGGLDLDSDGAPDWMFTSAIGTEEAPTATRVTVISGKTGARAFAFDVPHVGGDESSLRLSLLAADLTGDGKAEIALTRGGVFYDRDTFEFIPRHDVLIFSGADGAAVRTIQAEANIAFSETRAVSDVDGDGVADLAVGAPNYNQPVTPSGGVYEGGDGAIFIYSGATGERITIVTDTSGATTLGTGVGPFGPPLHMPMGVTLEAADLDGDGVIDLVAGCLYSPPYFGPGQSRIVSLDGNSLDQQPVFDGGDSDGVMWGHLGQRGFLFRAGRVTFLSSVEGFGLTDRILLYHNDADRTVIVAAPGGDETRSHIWVGRGDMEFLGALPLVQPIVGSFPPGSYTTVRAAAITTQAVYLERTRDGDDTPTTWRLKYCSIPGQVAGELNYLLDGTPVGAANFTIFGTNTELLVAIAPDDPNSSLVMMPVEGGTITRLDGFAATAVSRQGIVIGVGQLEGDPGPRPYIYAAPVGGSGAFSAIPVPASGSEWRPLVINDFRSVAGTYKTAEGETSVFIYRQNPADPGPAFQVIDPLADELIGVPSTTTLTGPVLLAITNDGQPLISFNGSADQAQLSEVIARGPFLVPADASMAVSEDGSVIVTRNAAGELLLFMRSGTTWSRIDLAYGHPADGFVYAPKHFGEIVTWTTSGIGRPTIALSTDDGLILIEPYITFEVGGHPLPSISTEHYTVRNLTTDIQGSEAITHSLITMLPHTGLRLISGLTADNELVLYGMSFLVDLRLGQHSSWVFTNLFDEVITPSGLPVPNFNTANNGNLIGYVTAWDGLNIAGVSNGHVVSFWTAPGLDGWRYTNLTESVLGQQPGFENFKNLSVYLTPWGGINIVGNNRLQVYWWTPGLGGEWRFDILTSRAQGGPMLRSETVTTYVTPWGGLNVAGLDDQNRLWVYWWTPASDFWTAEAIDSALPPKDRQIEPVGKLASTVSPQGEFSIFARTTFGNLLRYSWSPTQPWEVDLLGVS